MEKWKLIGIGFCGWHAKKKDHSGVSDYKDLKTLEFFAKEAEEGAVVYDASQANLNAYVDFMFKGPMIDFDLFGKEYELSDSNMDFSSKIGGFSGFDFVAPELYLCLMREYVPGVRFGKVINGKVEWEDKKEYFPKKDI